MYQTRPDGSPLKTYLTQSRRQNVVSPASPTIFRQTPSGIRYLYSGIMGAGAEAAVSVTLVDIADSGEDDLLCRLTFGAPALLIDSGNSLGITVSINDVEVLKKLGEVSSGDWETAIPLIWDFVLPAQSKLNVIAISATVTAQRWCNIVGQPL